MSENIMLLSDLSNFYNKSMTSNTGVSRKSLRGQTALVEVTKVFVEMIANEMKEMISTMKETESNKLEVQLKLFAEQMPYQIECNMRIYE